MGQIELWTFPLTSWRRSPYAADDPDGSSNAQYPDTDVLDLMQCLVRTENENRWHYYCHGVGRDEATNQEYSEQYQADFPTHKQFHSGQNADRS
jgi:hypothetical protein